LLLKKKIILNFFLDLKLEYYANDPNPKATKLAKIAKIYKKKGNYKEALQIFQEVLGKKI
jgi:hypothetical protein